jgi:glycerate 2-kinase
MPIRFVIAPSCFKESLSAEAAAQAIEVGVKHALPDASVVKVPIVDGGEGFARALVEHTNGTLREAAVVGPLGRKRRATFGMLGPGVRDEAVVEAAAAIGLRLMARQSRDPLRVSSEGVGMLILAALDAGAGKITIGCGDTANNDGGFGLSRALGARFLDDRGRELEPHVGALSQLARIDVSGVDPRIRGARLEVACNPMSLLTGPRGTSRVFAPYKGATAEAVEVLDQALLRLSEVIESDLGVHVATTPGAGSGGGMAAALHGIFGARLRPRYEIVLGHLPLDAALERADVAITGEGAMDETTLLGKVPFEVARRASARGVPVIALVGQVGFGAERNLDHGIAAILTLGRRDRPIEEALRHARGDLIRTAEQTARLLVAAKR